MNRRIRSSVRTWPDDQEIEAAHVFRQTHATVRRTHQRPDGDNNWRVLFRDCLYSRIVRQLYTGRFMRRTRSSKRGSERRQSNRGSTFISANLAERSSYAFWSHRNACSLSFRQA